MGGHYRGMGWQSQWRARMMPTFLLTQTAATATMQIETELRQKLTQAFTPGHLEISNESHMHSAPAGHTGPRESHFKAVIVSDAFAGKRLIQQHQAVFASLGDTMGKIHALALHTYTPAEWAARAGAPDSPACKGGSKRDPSQAHAH